MASTAYQATIDAPDAPRAVVFDLDPGPGCDLRDCARAALAIRDAIGPRACNVKTSGMKGLHVLVPLNGGATFAEAKQWALAIAHELATQHAWLTDKMPRELRTNRVFIDCSQNDPGKQTVAPYSLRATPIPLVSTPLAWSELADPAALPPIARIEPADVLARVARHGDLFADVLTRRQTL